VKVVAKIETAIITILRASEVTNRYRISPARKTPAGIGVPRKAFQPTGLASADDCTRIPVKVPSITRRW